MTYQKMDPSPEFIAKVGNFKARISMTKDPETGLWHLQFTHADPTKKGIDRQVTSHPVTGYPDPAKLHNFRRDVMKLERDYLTPGPARTAFEEVHAAANRKFVTRTKRRTPIYNAIDIQIGRHRATV